MASAFNNDEYKNEFVQSLKNVLEGKKIKYECALHELNKKGEAVGELIGGNLFFVGAFNRHILRHKNKRKNFIFRRCWGIPI